MIFTHGSTKHSATRAHSGFTLVELSIVLVIIAIVIGITLKSSRQLTISATQTATQNEMDTIEKSLLAFRRLNGRLPCPADPKLLETDTNYGLELRGATNGTCSSSLYTSAGTATASEGALPFKTLGIAKEFMYDSWGRKFAYALYPEFTREGAFKHNNVRSQCVKGIEIGDGNTDTGRSSSAVYALVSYGANGHGGYGVAGGSTRLNWGSTNTDELTNCHCSSSGTDAAYNGKYVLKDATNDATTSTNAFDDIVRYKTISQLQTPENLLDDNGYNGPVLAVGYNGTATGTAALYNQQCANDFIVSQPLYSTGTANAYYGLNKVNGVAFAANNTQILIHSAATGAAQVYNITSSALLQQGGAVPLATDDQNNTIALSDGGYLAISIASSPYFNLWRQYGSSFTKLNNVAAAPGGRPTFMSFSRGSYFLAVGRSTEAVVYMRVNGQFKKMAVQPTPIPSSSIAAIAFSPDGKYFAITEDAGSPLVHIWRVDGQSFTALPDITMASNSAPKGLAFSPDGKFFVVGGSSGDNIVIYKIDPNDVFTALTLPTNWTNNASNAGTGFAFSPDSEWIAMITANSALPVAMFRKVMPIIPPVGNPITFEYEANAIPSMPVYPGSSVAFIH